MATTYNSMDNNEISLSKVTGDESKTNMESTRSPEPIQIYSRHKSFYKSGIGLTFNHHQRSWIDPWETHATDRFIDNKNKNISSQNTSLTNIATAIEPNSLNKTIETGTGDTLNGEIYTDYNGNEQEYRKLTSLTPTLKIGNAKNKRMFGKWDGVVVRCLLNIFGVIMFLRVGWIVGQAGIIQTILIMIISTIITLLTTLSMSAICTNGVVLDGGAYYIISRTLGPAFGGSVGILFALGNMFAISMYLIGFAEALIDDLEKYNISITDDIIMDIRIWSNVMLVVVLILALIGLNIVIKAQIFLFIFIAFSIIMFFVGSFYRTEDNVLYGINGWINGNFMDNLWSEYVQYEGVEYNFWTVLAIFFPAVTGIMAGMYN